MSAQQREALLELLRGPVEGGGLDLEDVEVAGAGRRRIVRVLVDKDGGITLDDIADTTTEVSAVLDASDVLGENPYTLEVTSPGVDRPLTHPRHWRRNAERLVKVDLTDGTRVSGRIRDVHDDAATLDVDGSERTVAFAGVAKATVEIEFNRKGA